MPWQMFAILAISETLYFNCLHASNFSQNFVHILRLIVLGQNYAYHTRFHNK